MTQHDPVSGKKKPQSDSTSNRKPATASSNSSADGNQGAEASASSAKAKPASAISLRVNNNRLAHLDDIDDALQSVFEDPSQLQWLDVSGNALTAIHRDTFAPYSGIFTLHLHGNKLHKYSDIDNLSLCLPKLHSLTLHGNPIDEKKHYRNYVIASFPTLMQLDFSSITKGDREKAETWSTIYKNAFKSPRKAKAGAFGGNGDADQDS